MSYNTLENQAGSERIIASYKPFNRSITISSHWASIDEMLVEAKERYGIIQWYQVKGQEKVIL